MRHFGNVNLQQNQLQNAVLPLVKSFPSTPKVGQIAFIQWLMVWKLWLMRQKFKY